MYSVVCQTQSRSCSFKIISFSARPMLQAVVQECTLEASAWFGRFDSRLPLCQSVDRLRCYFVLPNTYSLAGIALCYRFIFPLLTPLLTMALSAGTSARRGSIRVNERARDLFIIFTSDNFRLYFTLLVASLTRLVGTNPGR